VQKKEIHRPLEQLDGINVDRIVIFWVNYPFKSNKINLCTVLASVNTKLFRFQSRQVNYNKLSHLAYTRIYGCLMFVDDFLF